MIPCPHDKGDACWWLEMSKYRTTCPGPDEGKRCFFLLLRKTPEFEKAWKLARRKEQHATAEE